MDMTNLPDNYLERRKAFLLEGMKPRAESIVTHILSEYPKQELLQTCSDFVYLDLTDGCRGDFDTLLNRLGFFPWVEMERELGEVLDHLLLARFKASLDSVRRGLELAVITVYFSRQDIPANEAKKWLRSHTNTPFFSNAVNPSGI